MVFVVGATGLVGSEVCERLARRGEKVRALVRGTSSKERTAALQSCGVELRVGDLRDPGSIAPACRGVNAVISTASSISSHQDGDSIESVDAAGQLNLANTAKSCNVERFLFVSFRRSRAMSFPLGDAKRSGRESDQEPELHHHSGELFYGSVAEPVAGIRLRERNGSHLRTGHGTDQLGFVPGRRRNVRCRASTSSR